MDFFFWGVLKDKVYSRKPRSVEELKNYIRDAFQEINAQICVKRFVEALETDFKIVYINQEGKQFEHLR